MASPHPDAPKGSTVHDPKVFEYHNPAGGWGALKAVGKHLLHSRSAAANARSLFKLNQPDGFDCPGCAWGDPEHGSSFEFCENGVKAVTWEATSKRVTRDFFAKHSVSELKTWDDYRLEDQGRLVEPMRYNADTDHYEPIGWDAALDLLAAKLKALPTPDDAIFYTSGKAGNESAYVFQLLTRLYGTNNLPDCSNMCHEASGVALGEALGTGKGSVRLKDFEHAEAIFVFGQNPGTNHPRMLGTLREAAERGATIVSINPLRERGLEKFADPQKPLEMLHNGSHRISSHYFCPKLGGDMAVVRGMAKALFERDAAGDDVLDHAFMSAHTAELDGYRALVEATAWETLEAQSGLSRAEMEEAAALYARSKATIICWAMGITQHVHSVPTVREIVNLLLLCGNLGKLGAGTSPVRGHSNVQGDRTMGIFEQPSDELLDALEARYGKPMPREHGVDSVAAVQAMRDAPGKVFIGLAGNFTRAISDSRVTEAAMAQCRMTAFISTKLNRSHLVTGKDALILPCLGRTEVDRNKAGKPQLITVEDSMSMVHGSAGINRPVDKALPSEITILTGLAERLLGSEVVDWAAMREDYDVIREHIEAVIPGFENFNERVREPRGFWLGNPAFELKFPTQSGKAEFSTAELPGQVMHQQMTTREGGWLTLQTMRSHDQYNTTVYGYNDRYRGIENGRQVIFLNAADIVRLGFEAGQWVNLIGESSDGIERRVDGFKIVAYETPEGCAAAYYPETNPLIPLDHKGDQSHTPASKSIAIRLEASARIA
ncbi:formate dehydrogenase F4A subunit [Vreelandella songnenensis]|uniref:Formate dehydrogenase F4A subunit n=1 Tax=Vreelandella songnenensis TaxID=1176243 RepID=A0A2T0V481_9GAMM|nr:FdhF/YdeP family oxidoreductase [Halomonas songnenensis]PRY64964.1 formate dehydrogenase F4A subunit [Halomonas songnenensis]